MILPHLPVNGRYLCCGMKVPIADGVAGAGAPGDTAAGDGALFPERPKARSRLMRVLAVLLLPIAFMGGEIYSLLFVAVMGFLLFRFAITGDSERWHGLAVVREEHELLLSVVPPEAATLYRRHLDQALEPLFEQRDRAFRTVGHYRPRR